MVVHGYKEQSHILASLGLDLAEPWFDTKLAGYLVQPDYHADSLEQAASHFLQLQLDNADDVAQGQLDLSGDVDPADQRKDLLHMAMVRALADMLAAKIDEREQFRLLQSIELPVSHVLFGMEQVGASVDFMRLTEMRDRFAVDARDAQEAAWQFAGSRVNLQSPKQLQKVLFEDMGLKPTKRTKSGSYTTNAAALQDLYVKSVDNERANGFLGALLRHREINKLKQIVQTLIDATNTSDERIHTTFEQTVAATGRLSSVDPNLQNIPTRSELGRTVKTAFSAGEGSVFLAVDYSQIELRILAHITGDEHMQQAFLNGEDIHRSTAAKIYGIPQSEVTPRLRSSAKAINFGIMYGKGAYSLAKDIGVTVKEADAFLKNYLAAFPNVSGYMDKTIADAKANGYVSTLFGRRRALPELASSNFNVRSSGERMARNTPIQGTAADVIKLAMVRVWKRLRDEKMESRLILTVHDELIVEAPEAEAEKAAQILREEMEGCVQYAVPLSTDVHAGKNWLEAH